MPRHDSSMRGTNSCANSCAEMDANVFISNNAATCAHVDFCRASGFLYSAISLCKNPGNLSWCFWIPVERNFANQESTSATNTRMDSNIATLCSTQTQIHNDKLLGFLHSKILLYRNPDICLDSCIANFCSTSFQKSHAIPAMCIWPSSDHTHH